MKQLSKTNIECIEAKLRYNAAIYAIKEIYPNIWQDTLLKRQMQIVATLPIADNSTDEEAEVIVTKRMDKMHAEI